MKRLLTASALLLAAALPLSTALPVAASTTDPVPALTRAAFPLNTTGNDLQPLNRMVDDARVVGVGEATHSSSEFFSLKQRIFESLVNNKGFTTFALEASWSTGLELDRYIVSGVGDPREIMRREFQDAYKFWNVTEYLDLFEWMRSYNRTHTRKLHFVGDDIGYSSPALIDRVITYAAKTRPALVPQLTSLYAGIRSDAEYKAWSDAYWAKPLAERKAIEAKTRQAVVLVESLPRSPERTWAAQHARAIWQTAKLYSFDIAKPSETPKAMYFRDQSMAGNVTWWTRTTGAKVVLSAHDGHIAYESATPADYPKVQGDFLREQLGRGYLNIGLTFDHGSFNSQDINTGELRVFSIPPAAPGSNEYTLDKVPYDDYLVDLRTLPRSARDWLATARPTRDIGTAYPVPDAPTRLAYAYSLLIHLNAVTPAHLRF